MVKMKSGKSSEATDCQIKVNDIFDELSEENKRLNNELMFANNCLKVLNKFKSFLGKILHKFETNIDSEDKQELYQLDEEFNSVVKSKDVINKRDINEEVDEWPLISTTISKSNHSLNSNLNKHSKKRTFNETQEESDEENGTQRKDNKRSVPSKGAPKGKLEDKEIPEPEEAPNSLLLLKRNNFDETTQRYVCPNPSCNKSYDTSRHLYNHFFMVHSSTIKYFCDYNGCEYRCKTRQLLETHSRTHSDLRPFECDICGKGFKSKREMTEHKYTHNSQPSFKCPIEGCNELFRARKTLWRHKITAHNHKHKTYVCDWPGCEYSAINRCVVTQHKKSVHSVRPQITQQNTLRTDDQRSGKTDQKLSKISENSIQKTKTSETLEDRVVSEPEEGFNSDKDSNEEYFQNQTNKRDENRSHSSKANLKDNEIPEPEEAPNSLLLLKRNNFDETTQTYVCPNPSCHKSYDTALHLYHHFLIVHSKTNSFVCDYNGCEYRTKTRQMLETHSRTHSDLRPYKCDICGKGFKSKKEVNDHKYTHNSQPSFKCPIEGCNELFRARKTLWRHKIRAHNEKHKTYVCDWPGCEYSAIDRYVVTQHKSLHTGEMPFRCEWPGCEQTFRIRTSLSIHMRTHSGDKPYVCEWPGCQYSCKQSSALDKHKSLHTGELAHVCPDCGKGFRSKYSLKLHSMVHGDAQPFVCDRPGCNYKSRWKTKLTRHKKTHDK